MDLREAGQQRHPVGIGGRGLDPTFQLPQLQPPGIEAIGIWAAASSRTNIGSTRSDGDTRV